MTTMHFGNTEFSFAPERGVVTAFSVGTTALLAAESPLFHFRLRYKDGSYEDFSSCMGKEYDGVWEGEDGYNLVICGFGGNAAETRITLHFSAVDGALHTEFYAVNPNPDALIEWIEVLPLALYPLRGEGGKYDAEMLYPFNEGALVDSMTMRQNSWFPSREEQYPSEGSYPVFPNMIFAQTEAYLYRARDGIRHALYFGAHDEKRGVKAIDFRPHAMGIEIEFRIYCGVDFGTDYEADFPLVIRDVIGGWEAAADTYRAWFEDHLPPRLTKICENKHLPDWYFDEPLIVSYPVRGVHDTDIMNPNALFPYTNGLPLIDEIAEMTDARLMVILMHWEGTAPWAPPYVWPAYGDPDDFDAYLNALHERGHMLGVYCSGFGYTLRSNLTDDYDCTEEYETAHLEPAMCAGPDGVVAISHICTAQRSGYDICPASELGRSMLLDAYMPLLTSKVDYAQILDQNHGGGQYFCYSREHGHAPAPGTWMTENMQSLLGSWNDAAGMTLLGCESAAAEPFIGNLLFSDNRYELCYRIGRPIPMYAYLYHEYARNFMGNQVCCPLPTELDTLCYRMAYSFSIGDCMTLVLTPDGKLMQNWGTRDFEHAPDKAHALSFIRTLTHFYRDAAKPYLCSGRMIPAGDVCCETMPYGYKLPAVHVSAWEADGRRVRIFVNPCEEDKVCTVDGRTVVVPAMNAILEQIV